MFKVIKSKTELLKIKDDWNKLSASFKNPLLGFEWYWHVFNNLYDNNELFILTIYDNDQIIGIAPFAKNSKNNILELAGFNYHYEPCSLLYRDTESKHLLIQAILKIKHSVILQRMPLDNGIGNAIKEKAGFAAIVLGTRGSLSGVIQIEGGWNEKLNRLSGQRRNHFSRLRKKLQKKGTVKFEGICLNEENHSLFWNEFLRIESSGWKGENKSSLIYRDKLKSFLKEYTHDGSKTNEIKLFQLTLDDEIIAIAICILEFNSLWELKIAFLNEYSKFSPGTQLTYEIMKYSFQNNLNSYEFLGSFDNWQKPWITDVREYETIIIYRNNPIGWVNLLKDIAKHLLNKILIIVKKLELQ